MNLIKSCLIFPGQGVQKLNMFKGNKYIEKTLNNFDYNINLLELNKNGLIEIINKTINTQLLLILKSYSTYYNKIDYLKEFKIDYCFGNSLGEYSALLISNSLNLLDMLNLIKQRGNLMENLFQSLNYKTMMLGVRITKEDIHKYLKNYNTIKVAIEVSNKTIIISGENNEILDLKSKLKKLKIFSSIFNNFYGFHNPIYMEKYEDEFFEILKNYEFKKPIFNVISNYDNKILDTDNIKFNWSKQMINTVKLKDNINLCLNKDIKNFIILGKDLLIKNSIIELSKISNKNIDIIELEDN